MVSILLNGEMYEVEPAVKVIIDNLMIEKAELKKENARLEELYQKSDCVECKQDAQLVKHGYWIEKNDWIACSNCNYEILDEFYTKRFQYIACPYCGAKMEKVKW